MSGAASRAAVECRSQKLFDVPPAVPSHDSRRYLVADGGEKDRGMVRDRTHLRTNRADDVSPQRPIVEKGDVLRPAHADHDTQATFSGQIEDVRWRNKVGANGVDSAGAHQIEIATHLVRVGKLMAVRSRRKGAIGDAAEKKVFSRDA
jgi:hypothetical protein